MEINTFSWSRVPMASVVFILLFVGMGFLAIGPLIGLLLATLVSGLDMVSLRDALLSPTPEVKMAALVVQGCATAIGLIGFPLLYVWLFGPALRPLISLRRGTSALGLLYAAFIVILFIPPNSLLVELNASWKAPDFLHAFERWARAKEEQAREITVLFTTFRSVGEFLVALVAIALLASVGEELVFRGLIQPELHRAVGNIHLAIVLSAMLFSAIHFQFFGFLPRFLLGVLFGYLRYWSGGLAAPMLAHFVNNAFALAMIYLHQLSLLKTDVESTEALPVSWMATCAVLVLVLLWRFRRLYPVEVLVVPERTARGDA